MALIGYDETMARLAKFQGLIGSAGLDAAALVPGATMTYLTNLSFHLSKRPLVLIIPAQGEPNVIVPALEVQRISDQLPFPLRFFTYSDGEGSRPAFEQACKALALAGKKVGVEGYQMRVVEGQLLEQYAPGCTLMSADDPISAIRLHKGADELAAMRQAIAISQAALAATLPQVKVGMTEQQVRDTLLREMAAGGGGGDAFQPIVLTGAKSAMPHGEPDDTPIHDGELLLFDFGTKINGYPSDITRTFAVGEIDPELKKIYGIVLAANEAGIRAVRPGVTAQEVDRAARGVIREAGYGEYFIHRTGHGLGLDIHEAPFILEGNTQVLEPGMVFTIEPGIYLPGKGGVRIEDNIVITETGAEVLTSYPKTLRVIGH